MNDHPQENGAVQESAEDLQPEPYQTPKDVDVTDPSNRSGAFASPMVWTIVGIATIACAAGVFAWRQTKPKPAQTVDEYIEDFGIHRSGPPMELEEAYDSAMQAAEEASSTNADDDVTP